jgi:hypothetical protein
MYYGPVGNQSSARLFFPGFPLFFCISRFPGGNGRESREIKYGFVLLKKNIQFRFGFFLFVHCLVFHDDDKEKLISRDPPNSRKMKLTGKWESLVSAIHYKLDLILHSLTSCMYMSLTPFLACGFLCPMVDFLGAAAAAIDAASPDSAAASTTLGPTLGPSPGASFVACPLLLLFLPCEEEEGETFTATEQRTLHALLYYS